MRLNNDWLNIISAPFGQIDSFKIYEGSLPASVGVGNQIASMVATATGSTIATAVVNIYGYEFSPDGTKLYISIYSNNEIWEYTLATPFDISTATKTFTLTDSFSNCRGLAIKPDGTSLFTASYSTDEWAEYILSTPFDLSTATAGLNKLSTFNTLGFYCEDFSFSPDGSMIFANGVAGANPISRVDLSTPWDITTGVLNVNSHTTTNATRSFVFSPDGMTIFANDIIDQAIVRLELSVAWDLSTVSAVIDSYLYGAVVTDGGYVILSPDGTKLYLGGWNDGTITEFTTQVYASDPFLADLTNEFIANANNTFLPVIDGSGTKMVWQGATVIGVADLPGNMAFFTMKCSNGGTTFLVDGTVTATGGGGDVEFASITVANGSQLAIDGLSFVFNDVFNT